MKLAGNRHLLKLVRHADKLAVLRKRNPNYKPHKFHEESKYLGVSYHFRSFPETAQYMRLLSKKGVAVPKVLDHGHNFILEEYIEGTPLDQALGKNKNLKIAQKFLNEVMAAHSKGLELGDRWGKNEILTPRGKVVFIDLDLIYDTKFNKETEMAEAINGVATFSKDQKVSKYLKSKLTLMTKNSTYDVGKIIWLLKKHIEFWGDPGHHLSRALPTWQVD